MEDIDHNQFEERADFIKKTDLLSWNVDNPLFKKIQNNLLRKGAKLIAGPRGTGKTHQMRVVYESCATKKSNPLAIYVSFGKYYYLEPLLYKTPEAFTLFHTWVLAKIIEGVFELQAKLNLTCIDGIEEIIKLSKPELIQFISQLEKGSDSYSAELVENITIQSTTSCIDFLCGKAGKKRSILLLDDAALSLTPDYLIEFFDVFRSLKTTTISTKASVYPGTTEYGPRFHIGHDAEKIDAWLSIDAEGYMDFMDSLIEKRFGEGFENIPSDIVDVFKIASFGIPRTFLGLLNSYIGKDSSSTQQKYNQVTEERAKLIQHEYLSLGEKLSQYKDIIDVGLILFEKIIEELTSENEKSSDEKVLMIGIDEDESDSLTLKRMIKFLIEVGLLHYCGQVKHGGDRVYNRYIPHSLFLIRNKIYNRKSRGFKASEVTAFFEQKSKKHPLRRNYAKLLNKEQINVSLALPACSNCDTPRLAEEQKFCHNCGRELVGQSQFLSCLEFSVEDLPLTKFLKTKAQDAGFTTIGDFISYDDPSSKLREVPNIGPFRSNIIIEQSQRFIEEFLG